MAHHLTKITNRAKQLKKQHPNIKWTSLIKKAAAELRSGVKKATVGNAKKSTTKKVVHHKKANTKKVHHKKKTMAKSSGRTVVVAGHHKKGRKVGATRSAASSKPTIWNIAKELGGNILGGVAGSLVAKHVPGKPIVKAGVTLGTGAAGMYMIPRNNVLLRGIAVGMGTAGGVNVLHTTGVMHGINEMCAGIFDSPNNTKYVDGVFDDREEQHHIPISTAGHYDEDSEYMDNPGYVGTFSEQEVDKWVSEGIPPIGDNAEDYM